jgi:hypothetical protein
MNPKETNPKSEISINGNMDGNIIVGNGNQINLSNQIAANKVASELAIRRLQEEEDKLSANSWDFISSEIMRDTPVLRAIITGKGKPCGLWFFNTMKSLPNFKINGEKVKNTIDVREISEIIWDMSPDEIQQVLNYLPSTWKGKDLEEIKKFGEIILDYAKRIDNCRSELDKHRAIVQS